MPSFSILLPPSEGKQPGGNPFAPDMFDYRTSNTFNYFNELNPERRALIDAVQRTIGEGEGLEELFGVQGEHLEEAIRVNQEIFNAPLMSALDRYSPGVMYKSMDFAGLPTGAQRRLLENGVIFSGLFGVLRPDDLIPNYRLRMDASLPEIGSVAQFWKSVLSPVLNRALEGSFVWNLLPAIHEEAWEDDHSYERMVKIKFFVDRGGERTPVTHGVKPLRGQLVNFIVRESLESLGPLQEWRHPEGFVYDAEETEDDPDARTVTVAMVKREG